MEIEDHTPTARGRLFLWGGIAAGVLLVVLLLTRGFGLLNRHDTTEVSPALVRHGAQIVLPEGSALRKRIVLAPVASKPLIGHLTLPGVVESDPSRTAAVLSPLAGRVQSLQVSLGDRVTAGQVLAVIDSPDLAQAYDDEDKASDAERLASRNLERQEGQHRIGAASDRDLDQARSDRAQAAAELTRTRARLRALGAAQTRTDRSRRLFVRAPFSGSVTALSVAAGNMINDPAQSIMTIADLSLVWITALVPEKDLAAVEKGQDAQVTLTAYPGRTLAGKVSFTSDVVEPDSHRNKLRIAFENPDHVLKPNMFASIVLHLPPRALVVVPTSALLMNNDRTSVFVAVAPWTFVRRIVEPKLEEGSSVAIDSGLSPGEQVVIQGGILLND